LPALWLFSDAIRMPNLRAVVGSLPKNGLCGVVYRHDDAPDRATLGRLIARLCAARRIALVVAGDARLAFSLRAGVHVRGGRQLPDPAPWRRRLITASAHNQRERHAARRSGAHIIFVSPVFATRSHPGARCLGAAGFRQLARRSAPAKAYALGGIDGASVRHLGGICAGAGAIDGIVGRACLKIGYA